MLNVLITIDTETYPISRGWKQDHLATDIKRDLYGEIDGHAVGLEHQLRTLARHGLKANFMLESLFAAVPEVGAQPLKRAVQAIMADSHDIQLHPHPEWIKYVSGLSVPFRSHLMRNYSLDEQEAIIRFATKLLQQAGAPAPIAFRAGGFAANSDTLIALSNCGIRYDSSFNCCYRDTGNHLPFPRFFGHIREYNGVLELPVSAFRDYPSHHRAVQLCACSSAEMIYALNRAEADGWDYFVIVSHSFEMLTRRRHPTKPPAIRWEVVERFERLCEFLGNNLRRFQTIGFSDMDHASSDAALDTTPAGIRGRLRNTAFRMLQQASDRIHIG